MIFFLRKPCCFAYILVAVLVFALLSCASNNQTTIQKDGRDVQEASSPVVSTQKTQRSLQSACKNAGFNIFAPEKIRNLEAKSFLSEENESIEIVYTAKNTESFVRIKKCLGNLDASGDFFAYENTLSVNDGGTQVLLRGPALFTRASWISGDYSFALLAQGEEFSQEEILTLVGEIR